VKTPTVSCPTCNAAVAWTAENRWKPFCSERCKLIDLGQWATEKYRVPVAAEPDELPEPDAVPTRPQ
jgi:endogenous inhibitor of DNA gyrase (YacG/DUF329 family)